MLQEKLLRVKPVTVEAYKQLFAAEFAGGNLVIDVSQRMRGDTVWPWRPLHRHPEGEPSNQSMGLQGPIAVKGAQLDSDPEPTHQKA